MGKSKLVKILIVLAVAVLFLYSVFYLLTKKNAPTGQKNNQTSVQTQNGQKINITGLNNQAVQVQDFSRNAVRTAGDVMVLANTSSYDIEYYTKDNSFSLSLLEKPLSVARKMAEQKLLELLQVDQTQACNLKINVGVQFSVDETYSGKNLGLSFCPGSVLITP